MNGTILLFILVLIMSIILIIQKEKMSEFHYLNVNSTLATKTGYLNPSDLGYSKNYINRLERDKLFIKIKKLINAPINAKVILNSGATESIATCINWAKKYNKYGKIVGSDFDHVSVEKNCKNMEMSYVRDNKCENISGVFLTHVNSKTGEILSEDLLECGRSVKKIKSDFDDGVHYKPLIFLDATQSITKIKIDMERNKYNAVFFSLHKIGGPMNMGIIVIDEPKNKPFIPLIAGEQNDGLRGGTLNETSLVENKHIFKMSTNTIDSRINKWNKMAKLLEENGIDYYKPKCEHLYNTFLINTHETKCPFIYINSLSSDGIYIGTTSACMGEDIQKMKGGSLETFLRISFDNEDDINEDIMKKIITTIKT